MYHIIKLPQVCVEYTIKWDLTYIWLIITQ